MAVLLPDESLIVLASSLESEKFRLHPRSMLPHVSW